MVRIDGAPFTTYAADGLIARYDLVVLADDRRFFPPYQAAALPASESAAVTPDGRFPRRTLPPE